MLNRTGPTGVDKTINITKLKIFGTKCYVHVPSQKRRKLDKKAIKGFLVGYCGDKDGFRVWIENGKIMLSRDVKISPEHVPEQSSHSLKIQISFDDSDEEFAWSVYITKQNKLYLILAIHVDDIFVFGNDIDQKKYVFNKFKAKDLDPIQHALSFKFERTNDYLFVNQKLYIKKLLEMFGMIDCKPASSPMLTGLKLIKSENNPDSNIPYQKLIGLIPSIVKGK